MRLNLFHGRPLVIATQHRKEEVIAPILETALGVSCTTPDGFDTDIFGTFSGEIQRRQDPVATARAKCLAAIQHTGLEMAIASEGSFGPHPASPFLAADVEVLLLVDTKNELEFKVTEISTQTNFSATSVDSLERLNEFASRAGFPSHGLILKKSEEDHTGMIKGITCWQALEVSYKIINSGGRAFAETDMRAMFNPSRMKVIAAAARKLTEKITCLCPQCETPGFDVTDARNGLPCSWCGSRTQSTLSYVYFCQKCSYREERFFPHGKTTEDPTYCDMCNP
jgi:hypothetical protein